MSTYFRNFPLVNYSFGDSSDQVLFQDVSVYADLLDKVGNDASFYHKYEVLSGDRPDTVSHKLYGTTDYYWTFYLLNNHVRESGWPLSDFNTYTNIQQSYPHTTVTVEDNIASTQFVVGATVEGTTSGVTGKIVERNLDLGQIVINDGGNAAFVVGELLRVGTNLADQDYATVYAQVVQYDSIHHHEDTNGDHADIDPFNQSSGDGYIPITYAERFTAKNNELKSITVLRPAVVEQISNEFQKLIKS